MPTIWGRNIQLQELYSKWGPIYDGRRRILGANSVIVPMGDPRFGLPTATTFTSFGDEQVTFTYSSAPSAWANAFDLTADGSFFGAVPILDFDGTNNYLTTPDAAFWSSTPGAAPPITWEIWARFDDFATQQTLFSKNDLTNREWIVYANATGTLEVRVYDHSEGNVFLGQRTTSALSAGRWYHIVITMAASAVIYLDGAAAALTNTNSGVYAAMEDTTSIVEIGADSNSTNHHDGPIAGACNGPGFAPITATADQVKELYNLSRGMLGV